MVTDPVSGTGMVGQAVKSDTAQPWAGTTIATLPDDEIPTLPISATRTQMQVRVWSPRADILVALKIETADDPTKSVETEAMVTTAETWQVLTFDFANERTGTAALNPDYTFNQISIFFVRARSGAEGGGGTFYFDDVSIVR